MKEKKRDYNLAKIIQNVINEIALNVLFKDCKFVVTCYGGYLCHKRVFINQEHMLHGDIQSHMDKNMDGLHFREESCKFIIYSVLEALKSMHGKNVLHRDIKPENILIHEEGYVKLCDLGMSRFAMNKERYRTCLGTRDYIAPEILKINSFGLEG